MATNMEDRMKKLLLASVAAVVLLGGSANAADLARPAPIYAPAPVVVSLFTWTGCYVGGNVGGVWAMSDWNDAILGDFGSSSATGALGGLQYRL
jgi:opacity protein-like surface antigen